MNDTFSVLWWADASYGVHRDMKYQTGGVISLRKGTTYPCSRKQKLKTTSPTKVEIVGTAKIFSMIAWVRIFLNLQGLDIKLSTLNQDNKRTNS